MEASSGPSAYDFEPIRSRRNPVAGTSDSTSDNVNTSRPNVRPNVVRRERLTSNTWCQCGNCAVMATNVECLCCAEVFALQTIIKEEALSCITEHSDFGVVCLNRAVLRTSWVQLRETRGHVGNAQEEMDNRSFRLCGYRQFVNWTWGYLGKKVRKVIPSCVVLAIRAKYPDPHNSYVGFRTAEESEVAEFYQEEAL